MRIDKKLASALLGASLFVSAGVSRALGDSTGYTLGYPDINVNGGSVTYDGAGAFSATGFYTQTLTLPTALPNGLHDQLSDPTPDDSFFLNATIEFNQATGALTGVSSANFGVVFNDGSGILTTPHYISYVSSNLIGYQIGLPSATGGDPYFSFLFGINGSNIGVNILPTDETGDTAATDWKTNFSYLTSASNQADVGTAAAVPLPKTVWAGMTMLIGLGMFRFARQTKASGRLAPISCE